MKQKTSTNRLILILIILLGFGGGYFYSKQLVTEPAVTVSPFANKKDNLAVFKDFKLNTRVLDSQIYQSLQAFGEFPVGTGSPGKSDLFQ